MKKGLSQSTNDSLYVMENSEIKFFSSIITYKPEKESKGKNGMTYPNDLDSIVKNSSIGQIIGPYTHNGSTKVAKLVGFNGSLLSARHILIAAQRTDSAAVIKAKRKVDSIMPLLNQSNFEEFVLKHRNYHHF